MKLGQIEPAVVVSAVPGVAEAVTVTVPLPAHHWRAFILLLFRCINQSSGILTDP